MRPRGLTLLTGLAAITLAACTNMPAALTQLIEARQLASELHVELTKAAEASNRAIMADDDGASAAAAEEARRARALVELDLHKLEPLLQSLGYRDDLRQLEAFKARFDEYRRLDDEILPLAGENTNVKAQRLSFGAAREAADAFGAAVDAAVSSTPKDRPRAEALGARARMAVLEIQVVQAPHIAEARDEEMTRLEGQMTASEQTARRALRALETMGAQTPAAAAALDRFMAINGEILKLSRRNSEVRSLALSLGRKRSVTAECQDHLRALEQALAAHEFTATR